MMKIFRNAILILTLFLTSLHSAAAVGGEWVIYPSLDLYSFTHGLYGQSTNNIQKLMDGEKYVYAIITSNYYAKTPSLAEIHEIMPMNIARLDKTNPNAKIEALATILPTSGVGVLTAEYSHQAGCLVVAYSNHTYDFIFDDGRIISNKDFANLLLPGGITAHSISFSADSKIVSVATDFGIIMFDCETGKTLETYNLKHKLNFANIVGDKVLAATDDAIYYFPYGSHPNNLESLPTLKGDKASVSQYILNGEDNIFLTYGIYPVDDKSFVFVGKNHAAADGISVNMAVIPDNPVEEPCMVDKFFSGTVNFNAMAANAVLAKGYREQGLIARTRDGLMVHNESSIYLLPWRKSAPDYSSATALKNYIADNTTILYKDPVAYTDVQSGQQKFKITATADGENFYYFLPRQGLIQRHAVETNASTKKTTWETVGDTHKANACPSGLPGFLYYTPEYGITVHNLGHNTDYTPAYGMTDGLATYRNGEWTQRSLIHTSFVNGYFNNKGTQVAVLSRGAIHDPNDPKYVYTRGRVAGLRRENIEDPSDNILLTIPSYMPTYANRVTATTNGTSTWCAFGEPDFDNDGTMWVTFMRTLCADYPVRHGELWYWTAEERAACKTPADYEAHPMKVLNIPGVYPSWNGKTVAGRTEKNRNILFHTSDNNLYDSFIVDHNGTPDDPSDDRVAIFLNLIDENGDEVERFVRPCSAIEDPYDGAFIFSHRTGMATMTKEQAFDYEKPHFSNLCPFNSETSSVMFDFGANGVAGIAVDKDLNKWLALKSGGLVCLSPDRSKIIAWYNTDNSKLPSNDLYSVAYNPETNSIFVGTRLGLAELVLDGSSHILIPENPSVSPRMVQPHFNGHVNFTGLTDAQEYTLIGPADIEIALGHPVEGLIQWSPLGYPTGIYRLKSHPEIEVYLH